MAKLLEKPRKVATDHFLLRIKPDSETSCAGQFINIRTAHGTDPLIRRPFSIFDNKDGILEIIIQEVGPGTRLLCRAEAGNIDILGPAGKGFSMVEDKRVLIVGGGVGNAPLYYLSRELRARGNAITYIYGSRSAKYIYLEESFRDMADKFILVTDDGSKGEKGFTTNYAVKLFDSEKFDYVYTCGPTPMMAGISAMVPKGTPVEVSLENYFGCGIGLCMGCTVETENGFKRTCIDGPVMEGSPVLWDTLTH